MPPAALIELFEAVRTHATAAFAYRAEERRVAPVGLWFRFGHWYLVAWDLDRTAVRTFRVDRIEGEVTRGEAGDAVVPDDVDVDVKAALPDEPWEAEGEDRVEMRIRVDALEARRVADEVGEDKVVRRHDDGSVDLVLGVSSFASIRSWVLGLLDHVTVVEPAAFREELVAWLDAVSGARLRPSRPSARCRRRRATPVDAGGARGCAARPGARRAGVCVACWRWWAGWPRWARRPSPTSPQRFGMSEKELVAELELAACCGTPPYTPDTLMEIEVSEHSVRAFLPAEYARPRRLTPAEGFAVAASARLLLAVPGSDDDALRRALAKLDAALGSREAVGLDVDAPAHLAAVRDAADAGRGLEIDYLSGSRDELTTRTVEPVQVVTIDGHWYLDAYCHRAGDMRRFRVDRIGAVRPLEHSPGAGRHAGRGRWRRCSCRGPVRSRSTCSSVRARSGCPSPFPCAPCGAMPTGTVTDVVLDVSGMAWFERLLLQLGPAARVVSPPELTGLAAEAARRVLARYEADRRRYRPAHERNERFQPCGHRGVPGQPRRGRRRVRGRPHGAADHDRRQVGEEAGEPARRARRRRHALRGRLQGRSTHEPGLVPQPAGPSRGRGRVRRRALRADRCADRRRGRSGTASTPPRWRRSPGFADYEKATTG